MWETKVTAVEAESRAIQRLFLANARGDWDAAGGMFVNDKLIGPLSRPQPTPVLAATRSERGGGGSPGENAIQFQSTRVCRAPQAKLPVGVQRDRRWEEKKKKKQAGADVITPPPPPLTCSSGQAGPGVSHHDRRVSQQLDKPLGRRLHPLRRDLDLGLSASPFVVTFGGASRKNNTLSELMASQLR